MIKKIIKKWLMKLMYFSRDVFKELLIPMQISTMSPIERHVYLNTVCNDTNIYKFAYIEWTMKRINKMIELYGLDFFKGKKILELGGGISNIGAFFAELGADVLSLEGRAMNVAWSQLNHSKIPSFKCEQFNLENDFSKFGTFDLIINFGLLYHLKNVEEHLNCCIRMSDEIVLDTVVCDSTDPAKIILVNDPAGNDTALEVTGSRPGPFLIEKTFRNNGYEIIRCFHKDLNHDRITYDWEHKNDNSVRPHARRFWRFCRGSVREEW